MKSLGAGRKLFGQGGLSGGGFCGRSGPLVFGDDVDAGAPGHDLGEEVQVPGLDVRATGTAATPVEILFEKFVGLADQFFNYPTDVALGPDATVYVADGYNDRIQVFSPDGKFSHKWGGPFARNISGPFQGWFAVVTSLTVDKTENVYAADFYNHRIQKFSKNGTFLIAFGEEGASPGQFNHPIAVAVADDGSIFVVDYGNNRIQRWQLKN